MRRTLPSLALALCAAMPAMAGNLSVSHATLRVISAAVPAAGYFEIRNLEDKPLVLTGARSSVCGSITMHQSMTEGGMARMRELTAVPLPPGGTVRFAPGGYHLMCMSPSPALLTAHTAAIRLEFVHYPPVEVSFMITDARGAAR